MYLRSIKNVYLKVKAPPHLYTGSFFELNNDIVLVKSHRERIRLADRYHISEIM